MGLMCSEDSANGCPFVVMCWKIIYFHNVEMIIFSYFCDIILHSSQWALCLVVNKALFLCNHFCLLFWGSDRVKVPRRWLVVSDASCVGCKWYQMRAVPDEKTNMFCSLVPLSAINIMSCKFHEGGSGPDPGSGPTQDLLLLLHVIAYHYWKEETKSFQMI